MQSAKFDVDTGREGVPETEWYRLKDAMARLASVAGATLKTFSFFCMRTRGHLDPSEYIMIPPQPVIAVLKPLLEINIIEVFTLICDSPFNLDTDDISAFAVAWPHLRKIRVQPERVVIPRCPDIRALVILATRCPKLSSIYLRISYDNIPPLDKVPSLDHKLARVTTAVPTHNHIDDGSSDHENKRHVLVILRRLFPFAMVRLEGALSKFFVA